MIYFCLNKISAFTLLQSNQKSINSKYKMIFERETRRNKLGFGKKWLNRKKRSRGSLGGWKNIFFHISVREKAEKACPPLNKHPHNPPLRSPLTTIYRRMARRRRRRWWWRRRRRKEKGISHLNKLTTIKNMYVKYWMGRSIVEATNLLSRVITEERKIFFIHIARRNFFWGVEGKGKFMHISTILHHNNHISVTLW